MTKVYATYILQKTTTLNSCTDRNSYMEVKATAENLHRLPVTSGQSATVADPLSVLCQEVYIITHANNTELIQHEVTTLLSNSQVQ